MPQHNPEDRVRVRNIVAPEGDDIQTLWITRFRKEKSIDANAQEVVKEFPYQKEIEWNYADGFLFFWGGKAYVLKRDEERTYSRFLADHCAKHMIDYILNKRYIATKRMKDDGTPQYDNNILQNEVLKNQIRNQIIVGVEEWFEGGDEDLDTLLAKKFGGDVDSMVKDRVNHDDMELEGIDQGEEDEIIKEIEKPKPVQPSSDPELQAIREEADGYGITYGDKESKESIKNRILKEMA